MHRVVESDTLGLNPIALSRDLKLARRRRSLTFLIHQAGTSIPQEAVWGIHSSLGIKELCTSQRSRKRELFVGLYVRLLHVKEIILRPESLCSFGIYMGSYITTDIKFTFQNCIWWNALECQAPCPALDNTSCVMAASSWQSQESQDIRRAVGASTKKAGAEGIWTRPFSQVIWPGQMQCCLTTS